MAHSLGGIFSSSAQQFPNRPALLLAGRQWSYRELDNECRRVERALESAGLTGKRLRIGLVYARDMFSYAAVIAILRSGNVYVPLNGNLSGERLLTMMRDADIGALVIDAQEELTEGVLSVLRECESLRIIGSQGPSKAALHAEEGNHILRYVEPGDTAVTPVDQPPTDDSDLAYIIYTSGSTGIPKGVAIRHSSVSQCMERLRSLFGTRETDRFTHFCPLSFDGSIFELFLCWVSGGALCVPEASETLVPLNFAINNQITVWGSVPSLAGFLQRLQLLRPGVLPDLRISFFFGEALPSDLVRAWSAAAHGSRVYNLYGPTEFSVCATFFKCTDEAVSQYAIVPIGQMVPEQSALIVDDGRVVTEDDVPGELWLSGDQLAAGYWNNPAATAAAFVRFPAGGPEMRIWYRTGDVVSQRSDVGLMFRGRVDRQIKLRGLRIELQEIEAVLRDVVGCALVAVVPLSSKGGTFEKIVAYCDKLESDEQTIKDMCLRRIPGYMVPERIYELSGFPIGAHGKIDYQALAAQGRAG